MFVIEQVNSNFGGYMYDENGQHLRQPHNQGAYVTDRNKLIIREVEGDDFFITDKPAGMLIIKKDGKNVACFEAKQWMNVRKVDTEE